MKTVTWKTRPALVALLVSALVTACGPTVDPEVPSADEVAAYYETPLGLEAEIKGNVASLRIAQDPQQLRRGGVLWAKVGPYIYLFSDETKRLFVEHPGLAAVRVTTHVGGTQVATAMLTRDELPEVLWRRGLNISGRARRDGTEQVTLLEDLVDWGEAHTEFEYSPRYTRR